MRICISCHANLHQSVYAPAIDERRFRAELAKRMREARVATWGPVQERCAEALKIRQSQISRWESGRQLPGAYDLARFARACNRTVDELLGSAQRPVLAEQLLLGLERKEAAVIVDLVVLLRGRKIGRSHTRSAGRAR